MNFLSNLASKAQQAFDSTLNEVEYRAKQLDQLRDKTFGTAGKDSWEQKVIETVDTVSANSVTGIADQGVTAAGNLLGKATNNPSLGTAAGLLLGAVMPGPGVKSKSSRALPPATLKKMEARDLMVNQNQMPTRAGLRNADFRGMSGDVQGGITGQPIRMEGRPDYRSAQTGLRIGDFNSKSTSWYTPHHRMGIQDNRAFFEGKTGPQAQARRSYLETGGLFTGNRGENYEPLFDGKLSSKKIASTGINSTDHFDVHAITAANRERMGIKVNKKDRSLDTFNGMLIKDMPEEQQLALQLQLGWADEMAINKVQDARYQVFKENFGHLPKEEQRKMMLENPALFANLSTNVLE